MHESLLDESILASTICVPGCGNQHARIVLLGEAPGEQEVKQGEPFVGQAGSVLNQMLQEVGIARRECWIDNVVQFRPKNNDFAHFEGTELLQESIRDLHERLHIMRPNIVVCLGAHALRAMVDFDLEGGITAWRGSVVEGVNRLKVLGTFHPSYLLRAWSDRPVTVFDLKRAKAESEFPEVRRKKREIKLNLTFEETKKVLNDILATARTVAFDIETESNTSISSIALAVSPESAVVVPVSFRGRVHWNPDEETELVGIVKKILESSSIQKIAQNAQYDMIWLEDKWGIRVAPLYMDTLVAHSLSMPEYDKKLAFQCSIYTDIAYYKHERRTLDPDQYFRYNGTDALATFECARSIEADLRESGLWEFYLKLPHALLEPLREMSMRGIKVNTQLRDEMKQEVKQERAKLIALIREEPTCHEFEITHIRRGLEAKLRRQWEESKRRYDASTRKSRNMLCAKYPTPEDFIEAFGRRGKLPEFNPNSSAQLVSYFYDFRGWKPLRNSRGDGRRTLTVDQDALRKLLSRAQTDSDRAIVQAFLDLGNLSKELEFLEAKIEADGRLHCTYDITGTETGRISSKKYVYDTGANLQNQPAGKRKESVLRRVFVPDVGKVFLQRDLKQAEAWIVAFLCEDPFFMEAIRSSDIHRKTASLIFRKPEGEVTKQERSVAKSCVHALNYGMGFGRFAELTGMPPTEARDIRNRYFAAFPRLQVWHSEIKLKLARDRELVTPLGRKRQFAAGWNEDLWKEAWAYLPQSTVGDLLNIGFLEFWRWLKALHAIQAPHLYPSTNEEVYDCQIMLQIHDSLVVQCPEQHVATIASKLKSCLEKPIVVNGHRITIPTDCSVGENWLDLKEVQE